MSQVKSTKSTHTSSFAHSAALSTSDKKLSFADLLEKSGYKIPALRRNQEVTGTIVSVSPQEILIDIGAKSEGIVAGRELAQMQDLISQLAVGEKVEATVILPENDAGQVVLSLRRLSGEKRWAELEDKRESNEDIDIVAMEVNRGGVICDYLGIRGFLPASQLSSSPARLTDLIGKTIKARVIEVDRQSNRLILTQKGPDTGDLAEKLELLTKVEIGSEMEGVVSAVLPFGVFVEVDVEDREGKLEGLVHVSEVSWEKIDDVSRHFKVGDKVNVLVIAKDEGSGRLNLSVKQLQEDPFVALSAKYSKDQFVSGSVARVTPFGVFVTFEDGLEGLVHISKIPPNISYEVGQKIQCSIDSVDVKMRKISLVPIVREKPVLYR